MTDFVADHITLITYVTCAIGFIFALHEIYQYWLSKPRYKLDADGFVMYYYAPYNHWSYLTGWDDNRLKRTVTIHDTIRGIVFDYEYEGPGRYKFKMTKEELKSLPYKTCREIYKEQEELIDKENTLLKEITKSVK
jgi:hypothetical protein